MRVKAGAILAAGISIDFNGQGNLDVTVSLGYGLGEAALFKPALYPSYVTPIP